MNQLIVYGKAMLAMLFWAVTFVWIKVAYAADYRPYEITFLRLLLAVVLLFTVILLSKKKERMERKDVLHVMLVAFCEPFAYFVGEANGMQYVSPTLGSLIISLIPIVTAVGAWFLLRERISPLLVLGLVISTGGVVLMSLGESDMQATLKGILFLLLAVFAGMFYGITVRRLTLKYSALTIVSMQSLFGLLYFTPLVIYYDLGHFITMQQDAMGLLTIAAMSVFASVGAFMLYTGVIRDLGVIKSNIFTNLIPVFTSILAFFILDTSITLRVLAGLSLTIGGLLLSQYQDLKKLRNFS
jgi:drug/metabolite transporter (DMT)-like permease